jgi:hypothetical protein
MANQQVSIGDQVAGAQMAGGGGTYFLSGMYDLTVTDVKVFLGQTDQIPTVAVEFMIDKYVPKGDHKLEDRPVGTTVSWVQKLRPDIKKTILGNLKSAALVFMQQLAKNAGLKEWESIGEEHVTQARIDNDIFCNNSKIVGLKVRSEAYDHQTKGKKEWIVLNKWMVM